MNTVNFSTNWNNKLYGRCFTTIRISDKYEVGEEVEVWLRLELLGRAVVIDRKRLASVDALNEWVCLIDTGYPKKDTIEILKGLYKAVQDWTSQPIYLYLFRYVSNTIGGSDATTAPAPARAERDPATT